MTKSRPLEGKRILIIEDDYYLATDEEELLQKAGAEVVGPFGSGYAPSDLADAGAIDAAVVDINLGQGLDFGVVRDLHGRGVPFVFVTGYDAAVIPSDLSDAPRVEKPVRERDLVAALAGLVQADV